MNLGVHLNDKLWTGDGPGSVMMGIIGSNWQVLGLFCIEVELQDALLAARKLNTYETHIAHKKRQSGWLRYTNID